MAINTPANASSIATVQDYLAQAIMATNALEPSVSSDLCVLLRLAVSEADRVRKASKKVNKQNVSVKAVKAAPKAKTKKAPKNSEKVAAAPKTSRKSILVNGAAH